MEFEYLVPEDARLRARITQRSNLKYVHTVVEHFDERQRQQFRESCLGFLANIPDIQFSAQLIHQLVFRTIRTEKRHELWFNLQGHLSRFGLQEYAVVTGLRCGVPPDDNQFYSVLGKTRLQDKYFKSVDKISCAQLEKAFLRPTTPRGDRFKLGLALIVEGVFNAPDNNVGVDARVLSIVDDLDIFFSYPWGRVGYTRLLKGWRGEWAQKFRNAKRKKENETSYTIHGFPIAMQVWAFEVVLEIGELFGQRLVGNLSPRILNWTATKQTQQRTYDKFFKNVKLHVYATLRPSDLERQQSHISTLIPFDDHVVPSLDEVARTVVGPQFDADADIGVENNNQSPRAAEEDEPSASNDESPGMDDETVGPDDRDGPSASEQDDDGSDSSGDGESRNTTSKSDRPRGRLTGACSGAYTPYSNLGRDFGPSTSIQQGAHSTATPSRSDVEGMLLNQRILIEMQLRTVKLELIEHVNTEFGRLREYISTLVGPTVSRSVASPTPDPIQPEGSTDLPQEDIGRELHHSPVVHAPEEANKEKDGSAEASRHEDHHADGSGQEDEHAKASGYEDDHVEGSGLLDVRGRATRLNDRAVDNSRRRSKRIRRLGGAMRTPYTRTRGRIPRKSNLSIYATMSQGVPGSSPFLPIVISSDAEKENATSAVNAPPCMTTIVPVPFPDINDVESDEPPARNNVLEWGKHLVGWIKEELDDDASSTNNAPNVEVIIISSDDSDDGSGGAV